MTEGMTLGEMAKALNRSTVYLQGLQARFELPVKKGAGYSEAYFAFLMTLVYLRTLSIPEETLRELWHIEKKLLQLLYADTTGSPTWYLDACCQTDHPKRRLLLTNHDLGVEIPSGALQLGLNFSGKHHELFAGKEMGEDALRVLSKYVKLHTSIRSEIQAELPHVLAAADLAKQV